MPPNARSTRDGANKQREAKNETVVESTFHNIVDYYTNSEALSKALIEAKKKCKNLEQELKALKQRVSACDSSLLNVEKSVSRLLCLVLEEEKKNLQATSAGFTANTISNMLITSQTMASIKASIDIPNGFRRTAERLPELGVEIEKAKMFIKILEGVQGVSAAGGIKRPRKVTVKEEPGSKKQRTL